MNDVLHFVIECRPILAEIRNTHLEYSIESGLKDQSH